MPSYALTAATPHPAPPLDALHQSLERQGWSIPKSALIAMADTGLAHWHVRIRHPRGDWVARIPKQSQMQISAHDNLSYQTTCFERAQASGHTPRLHGVLPCDERLPRGALLVEAIEGRPARLPDDLPNLAQALASLHHQPLPPENKRTPLLAPANPWHEMLKEIRIQASHLDAAQLNGTSHDQILQALETLPKAINLSTIGLISFDAHPGNFLIEHSGRAVLVDLEKCRYSLPGFDLAHLSLYTSTTWDINTQAVLTRAQVISLYQHWQSCMQEHRKLFPWQELMACRRAMWLWSLTWCAKWRATNSQQVDSEHRGEDWSNHLSDDALVTHVRERVEHYLSPPVIGHVARELDALDQHSPSPDHIQ